MSQDPYLEREAEKYASPIPSREFILMHLAKRKTPASREELAQELSLSSEEDLEALRRRLRAMERDGQLIFTRRQCYALPERLDLIKGTVIGHRDGFGFLRSEGQKEDLYLSPEQMKMCMHGDVILAQVTGTDRRGRKEVRVVRVVEPRTGLIVGRYFTDAGTGFVVPDDGRLSFDILIPSDAIAGARMGYVVVVELTQRPTRRTKAVGKIVEVLGDNMGTGMAVDIALRSHDIPHAWPEQVERQVADLSEEVPEAAKVGRIDLRDLPLVTIDGEDARDFDDAVYCEKKRGGGWRLWVAIADVSYYVRPNTALDHEARSRGNSVYFPSQVVPMLPEVLSNGLCSLNPQVDRLCMVCEMTIAASGRLSSYKFYEAVMSSHARLTYTKVAHILAGDPDLRAQYHALVKPLEELHALYKALDHAREERGGISFETEEAKFIFNAERRIERIEPTVRNDAHKLIEECMILANISAARFMEKNHEPALFRIHDKPSEDHVMALRTVLAELGLSLGGGTQPEPKDYALLMDKVADRPDHEMLQTMLLRSMKQAVYDPENRGHFGLALQAYAHFTSPIRRYPDLSLHRGIKYLLAREHGHTERWTPSGGWHYHTEDMLQLGEHCSMTERRADEATRDVSDWLKCDFMQDHVGQTYGGIITSVTGFGFFVRLDDLFIDGLVHVSTLDNDYYRFDQIGQRLIGESSGQVYRLGDKVEVKVDAVHLDERKIDFALISTARGVRGAGKTARNKARQANGGTEKKPSRSARRGGKMPANFAPDSVQRRGDEAAPAKKGRGKGKGKKPSVQTRNIAASTKAKRARKKTTD
ncbi:MULTISPECIES: ribonuclease R [Edwardsiella]|uniref:Ribonuclease R n=5 Tax=Edwardsiella anguillarum TaxID=1821960 RepID=A0A076LSJ9_9GAMM|nr:MULTISPECIES: ribonuclease R [Edwardsiella]AKM46113.1 exoribonuclease R [Edwardsiella sp. EA181011]GAJ67131.1 3'-to-5' exoribonuclease RNase R [Edwardsiella piscicida]AIJ08559.1 3'-to-5' exoribonuclease RNase R [Edwardsiella anguillarum ET080813]AKR76612.1 ribonuclease R [Edwardsiella sp. LADL05-105]KAB0592988.1 ribonuclease R [Edwardsiella anguillarum]